MNAPHDADDALAAEMLANVGMPSALPLGAPMPPLQPFLEPVEPPEPDPERIPEFDARYREPFEGLLYLGHLTETVSFFGHTFRLVTPSSAERLQVGLVTKPYDGTIAFDFAYACGLVAAYLIEVDGRALPQPITNDPKDTAMNQRFEWVLGTLRKPVIDHLFNSCFNLDEQVRGVLDAMGKASG